MNLEGQGRGKFQIEPRFRVHLPHPPVHSCPRIPLRGEVMIPRGALLSVFYLKILSKKERECDRIETFGDAVPRSVPTKYCEGVPHSLTQTWPRYLANQKVTFPLDSETLLGDATQIPGSSHAEESMRLPALEKAPPEDRRTDRLIPFPPSLGSWADRGAMFLPCRGCSETPHLKNICPPCSSDPLALFP